MRRSDWLLGQLPVGMLDDSFFFRFVSMFQEVASSYLDGVDNLDYVLDPTVAPPPMVRYLALWLGLPAIDPGIDEMWQRTIVKEMGSILPWRSTRSGLERYLTLLTGAPVEVVDGGGVVRQGEMGDHASWVRITVQSTGWLNDRDLIAVVRDEVPASTFLELRLGGRLLWPTKGVGDADRRRLPDLQHG
jgi:phage tail-like protein